MKFWPKNGKPSLAGTRLSGTEMARVRQFFSWGILGAALLGVMFARWTWLLFAPAGAVMPPALPDASDDAGRIFGAAQPMAAATATLTPGNIKLVGVFANPAHGFAVVQIDGKQLGVPLGGEVRPGVRLVETHSHYVVLEQGGVRSRLDLSAASAPAAAAPQQQPDAGNGTVPVPQGDVLPQSAEPAGGGQ